MSVVLYGCGEGCESGLDERVRVALFRLTARAVFQAHAASEAWGPGGDVRPFFVGAGPDPAQ